MSQSNINPGFLQIFAPRRLKDLLYKVTSNELVVDRFFNLLNKFSSNKNETACNVVDYENCLTAFGYFADSSQIKRPEAFVEAMLYRGCARQLKPLQSGSHLALPIVFDDGRAGLCLIQVRAHAIDLSKIVSENRTGRKSTEPEPTAEGNLDDSSAISEETLGDLSKVSEKQDESTYFDYKTKTDTKIITSWYKELNIKNAFFSETESSKEEKEFMDDYKHFPVCKVLMNLNPAAESTSFTMNYPEGPLRETLISLKNPSLCLCKVQ